MHELAVAQHDGVLPNPLHMTAGDSAAEVQVENDAVGGRVSIGDSASQVRYDGEH